MSWTSLGHKTQNTQNFISAIVYFWVCFRLFGSSLIHPPPPPWSNWNAITCAHGTHAHNTSKKKKGDETGSAAQKKLSAEATGAKGPAATSVCYQAERASFPANPHRTPDDSEVSQWNGEALDAQTPIYKLIAAQNIRGSFV